MSYRLWYFPFRGRAEQIRLLLHTVQQPFENVTINREGLLALKKEGPTKLAFGSVPMLEDGDFRLVQGPAIMGYLGRKHGIAPTEPQAAARAEAITLGAEDLRSKFFTLLGRGNEEKQAAFLAEDWKLRWLPGFEGLLQNNGSTGFMVGDQLSYADIAVWDALDGVLTLIKGASLEGFPGVIAFQEKIAALPTVQAYVQGRSR